MCPRDYPSRRPHHLAQFIERLSGDVPHHHLRLVRRAQELLAVRPLLDDVPADLALRLEGIVDSDDEGYPLDMWRERWRKKDEIQRRKNEADYKKLLADAAEQSLDPDSVPPAAPPRWKAGRVRSTRPEDWPAG
jgi:hypothetical protein